MASRLVLVAGVVAMLAACGQKGPLYLPKGPEAASRATLPQTILRPASAPPVTGTAKPLPDQ